MGIRSIQNSVFGFVQYLLLNRPDQNSEAHPLQRSVIQVRNIFAQRMQWVPGVRG